MTFSFFVKLCCFSGLLLAGIYGCDIGCKKIFLSAKDKSWLDFASVDDTIIFSDGESLDTFVVVDKFTSWGDCNRFELGEGQREVGEITVRKVQDGRLPVYSGSYSLSFNGDYSHDIVSKSSKFISVLNIETNYFRDFSELTDTIVFIPPLNKNLRVFFVKPSSKTRESTDVYPKIDEYYWNKEFGLVGYKKRSGGMFYFSKKW